MLILVYELKGENLSLRSEDICNCQRKKEISKETIHIEPYGIIKSWAKDTSLWSVRCIAKISKMDWNSKFTRFFRVAL